MYDEVDLASGGSYGHIGYQIGDLCAEIIMLQVFSMRYVWQHAAAGRIAPYVQFRRETRIAKCSAIRVISLSEMFNRTAVKKMTAYSTHPS